MSMSNGTIPDFNLENYLNNSNMAYIIFTPKLYPMHWNKAAEKLLPDYLTAGLKTDLDAYFSKAMSPDEYKRISFFFENFKRSDAIEFETNFIKNKSEKLILKFGMTKQNDGNFFVTIDNITKQQLKEQFLISAKQDAEKASSMRSLFLANVSHEIRTPIQTIIGMTELINDTKLDEEQREYIRQVNFSADVLLALVNDVLDFSKLETGNMLLEDEVFNLTDSIEQTVDLVSIEAHKKGLEVVVDIDTEVPEFVSGDSNRLQQVLLNFVKNAVKFTEKGFVSVSVKLSFEYGDSLEKRSRPFILFEVADTGIGVTNEQKQRIFNSFYQGNAAINRKYGGTGLGLAISKNIVTMMGGTVGIRDNFQGGSVFWFKISLKAVKNNLPQENILLDKRTRFLLVDDNIKTRTVLKKMLLKFGFEDITMVTSGAQALEIMQAAAASGHAFDVIFADMVMPEMDGWRLGAEIHNTPLIKSSKLYLMIPEGSLGADAKMKLLQWFDGYLYKPLKRRIVFNLLNDIYRKFFAGAESDSITELEPLEMPDYKGFSPSAPAAQKASLQDDFSGAKILAVDDHPVNKQLLQIMLEKAGCTVTTAADGQEAVNEASKTEFDIIFMDIQMPILNGYEAAQFLRERGYKKPIIACTAGSQDDERKLCLSMGMNDIITKPFNKARLFEIVKKYCEK